MRDFLQSTVTQILPDYFSVISCQKLPTYATADIWKQRIVNLVGVALRRIENVRRGSYHFGLVMLKADIRTLLNCVQPINNSGLNMIHLRKNTKD